jgi:hypothetical protein
LYPTIVLGGIVAVVLNTSLARDLCKKLYPDTAGIRSQYYKFFTTDRSRMVGSVIVSLIILLIPLTFLFVTAWNRYLILVFIQLAFLMLGGLFLSETRTASTDKKKRVDVVKRIKDLLELAGYQTEISPRTQDASIDPLLANLDIFARRENHNLLLDIKSPMDADKPAGEQADKPVDWKSASTLIQSAYLFGSERDIQPKDMDVRLLLIDVEPDKSLRTISKQENISVLTISNTRIDEILGKSNKDEQKQAIQELLDLHPGNASLAKVSTA